MSDLTQSSGLSVAQPCFGIFEGGGAKGITHIGALKAMERSDLVLLGVAGTSAGAIIAALTAVGYTADELFDPIKKTDILTSRNLSTIDLLGSRDWSNFVFIRRFKRALYTALVIPLIILASFLLITARIADLVRFPALRRLIGTFGFFSTEKARDELNKILFERLAKNYKDSGLDLSSLPKLVRFRDIDPINVKSCLSLKIIATNLSDQSVALFGRLSTPDVVVADAVAASFAIPFFFRAARIRSVAKDGNEPDADTLYADGGLVSNLPVWTFTEDKRVIERGANKTDSPIPIIAFSLIDSPSEKLTPSRPWEASVGSYTTRILRTAVSGGQSVIKDFVSDLTLIELPSPLSLLEFDCGRERASHGYKAGLDAAQLTLVKKFVIQRAASKSALQAFVNLAVEKSKSLRGNAMAATTFRASMVAPFGRYSFQVVAALNMDDDSDDHLILDQNNPAAPTAFRERKTTFVNVTSPATDLRMTKYERALVRATLVSVISFPIFDSIDSWSLPSDRPVPLGVLCLDSDILLDQEYRDDAFMRSLSSQSVQFAELMKGLRS